MYDSAYYNSSARGKVLYVDRTLYVDPAPHRVSSAALWLTSTPLNDNVILFKYAYIYDLIRIFML